MHTRAPGWRFRRGSLASTCSTNAVQNFRLLRTPALFLGSLPRDGSDSHKTRRDSPQVKVFSSHSPQNPFRANLLNEYILGISDTNSWNHVLEVSQISATTGPLPHVDSSAADQLESLMNGSWRGQFSYETGWPSEQSGLVLLAEVEPSFLTMVYLAGSRRDQTGVFTIQGHVHDNNRFAFEKSHRTHKWTYSGSIDREHET
jgi:hypothetical protein